MSNFEKITASPEMMGKFLAAMPIAEGPWDAEFQKQFCAGCQHISCNACPHGKERNNPTWWLKQTVMWVYGLDHILPNYRFCPMCGRRMDGDGNDPLTLDELRKMDGEPVWIVSPDGRNEPCWMLVDMRYELCLAAHGGMAVLENLGKTWLAYRRRPEEGATNDL